MRVDLDFDLTNLNEPLITTMIIYDDSPQYVILTPINVGEKIGVGVRFHLSYL
jgi:hypothetical protein